MTETPSDTGATFAATTDHVVAPSGQTVEPTDTESVAVVPDAAMASPVDVSADAPTEAATVSVEPTPADITQTDPAPVSVDSSAPATDSAPTVYGVGEDVAALVKDIHRIATEWDGLAREIVPGIQAVMAEVKQNGIASLLGGLFR